MYYTVRKGDRVQLLSTHVSMLASTFTILQNTNTNVFACIFHALTLTHTHTYMDRNPLEFLINVYTIKEIITK